MNMFLAGNASTNFPWLDTLIQSVYKFINPVLIVCAVAGILYAIVVGVKFVKADDKSQRDEAKQKLITVIIGVVVTFVLVGVFYYLAYAFSNGIIDLSNLVG